MVGRVLTTYAFVLDTYPDTYFGIARFAIAGAMYASTTFCSCLPRYSDIALSTYNLYHNTIPLVYSSSNWAVFLLLSVRAIISIIDDYLGT